MPGILYLVDGGAARDNPRGLSGEPAELISTLIWLCGPGASFVNRVVVPVDGGFSAFSGV